MSCVMAFDRLLLCLHEYLVLAFALKEEGKRKCIHGRKNGKKGKKTRFNHGQLCSCSPLVFMRRLSVVVLGNRIGDMPLFYSIYYV